MFAVLGTFAAVNTDLQAILHSIFNFLLYLQPMIVSIHQPNYIPWAGYFHKITRSDIFVVLDDVQFTKGSVANRNVIKGTDGKELMLTVPVMLSQGAFQNYNDIAIDYKMKWNAKHIKSIRNNYAKAPYFKEFMPELEEVLNKEYKTLSELNMTFILWVLRILDIKTKVVYSSDVKDDLGVKNDRVINLCRHFGATIYLSGNGARKYNDEEQYKANNIKLLYTQFQMEPYQQLFGAYVPNLSIIDMIFNLPPTEVVERITHSQVIYS